MDRLLSMEVFVSVVEAGSFTAAAERHRLSTPMIGKHIRYLEDRLGSQLLVRTTRRQALTEIGKRYYDDCKKILSDVAEAESGAEAMRAAPRGRLRVTASVTFGSLQLAPAVADYLQQYPEVSVELVLNDRPVDLIEEGFDLAVRIGRLADSSLIARPLQPFRWLICASPDYLRRAGVPQTPDDIVQHQCLGSTLWSRSSNWRADGDDAAERTIQSSRFQANNGHALRAAALRGFGLLMQPEILLADDIASGRLIEVLHDYAPPARPMHLIYPQNRRATPKLQTLIAFLLHRFG